MFHVADHADDFAHFLAAVVRAKAGLDPFPDDVLTREKFVREAFIHDHDRRGIEAIGFVEDASLPHGNAHGLEIISRR